MSVHNPPNPSPGDGMIFGNINMAFTRSCPLTNTENIRIRKFCQIMPGSGTIGTTKNLPGMVNVFLCRTPFNIFYSIICALAIFMIYLISPFPHGEKGARNQPMYAGSSDTKPWMHHPNKNISISFAILQFDQSCFLNVKAFKGSHSSTVRHFIPREIHNWEPFFYVTHDHEHSNEMRICNV